VRYFGLRMGQALLLLVGVSLLSFVFLQLAPGDFFSEMRLNPQVSSETVDSLRQQYGLDRPLPVRYWRWLRSVAHGELGFSFAYNSPVAPLLGVRARNTLLLTSMATFLAWSAAIPLGVLSAASPQGWLARSCSLGSATLLATPDLLLALAGLMFAVRSGWLRIGGMASAEIDAAQGWLRIRDVASHLLAPVTVLVLGSLPILLRHTTSAMREALASPFVSAARAHGIGRTRILFRHALPAAMNPLVSLMGASLASLLSASLLVEVVMGWPGIGPLLLEAILNRDLYVVIGVVMLSTFFLVAGMLTADLLLFVADPRIRREGLA